MKSTVTLSDLTGDKIVGIPETLTVTDPQDSRKVWVLDISAQEAAQFVGKGLAKGRPGRPKKGSNE